MPLECELSFRCREVSGVWLLPDELLADLYVLLSLERLHVAGQVPVRYIEQLLQPREIGRLVHHEHRHDAEPHAVIECFVDMSEDVFHAVLRSNLRYIYVP